MIAGLFPANTIEVFWKMDQKDYFDFGKDILPPDLLVEQTNVNQANVFGNNQQNDSEVILKLIQSYEKQLQAKDEQINKLIEKIH